MNCLRAHFPSSDAFQRGIALLMLGLAFSGCAHRSNSQKELSAAQLVDKINSGWKPSIVDVRSNMEYEAGHVPGAVHLSFWTPLFAGEDIQMDRDKSVVIYCEHGPRAYIAGFGLRKAGFKNIFYLDGHMANWRKKGLPIEK